MIPAPSSFCSRSARMLVAIPSPDASNSLNVRKPRTIKSRMISNDQRSPNLSSEILTGQPDRGFDLGLPGTSDTLSTITCEMQVIIEGVQVRLAAKAVSRPEGWDSQRNLLIVPERGPPGEYNK